MDFEVSKDLVFTTKRRHLKVQVAAFLSKLLRNVVDSCDTVILISSTVQGPAADLAAAAAAPQHGGHPALLPAGALLRPPQHAPAPHHEARQLQVIFTVVLIAYL